MIRFSLWNRVRRISIGKWLKIEKKIACHPLPGALAEAVCYEQACRPHRGPPSLPGAIAWRQSLVSAVAGQHTPAAASCICMQQMHRPRQVEPAGVFVYRACWRRRPGAPSAPRCLAPDVVDIGLAVGRATGALAFQIMRPSDSITSWCASCSESRLAASSSTAWRMPGGWSIEHCSLMLQVHRQVQEGFSRVSEGCCMRRSVRRCPTGRRGIRDGAGSIRWPALRSLPSAGPGGAWQGRRRRSAAHRLVRV